MNVGEYSLRYALCFFWAGYRRFLSKTGFILAAMFDAFSH